jgi:ActR/RegA family two-component response regulator
MLQNILSPRANPHEGSVSSGQPMTMLQMQSWYAEDVLARVKNNKSEAARLLDIDYKTLLRYVNRKGTL